MELNLTFLPKNKTRFVAALLVCLLLLKSTAIHSQISQATITVNSAIVAPTGATSSAGSFALCGGTTTTITPTGGNTGTDGVYKWYTGSCGGTLIATGPTLDVTVTQDSTIYVRIESPVCGNSTCDTVNLTASPAPTGTTTLSNIVACYNVSEAAIPLTGTPSGVTFDISGGADVGIADATGATSIAAFTTTNTTNDAITRTITVTPKANGCTGTPQTFTVTVLPEITATPVSDIAVCNGAAVNVPPFTSSVNTVSPLGTTGFAWTNDLASIGLAATGSGNIAGFNGVDTATGAVVANVTLTPTYTIGGTTCNGTNDQFTITVNPTPNGIVSIDSTICSGTSAPLIFTATHGNAYGPWTVGIAEGSAAATPTSYPGITDGGNILTASPTATTTYYLMSIQDANGCTNP